MIFISFCSEDRKVVEPFAVALKRREVPFWLYTSEMGPGDDLPTTLDNALRDCTGAILFLSKTYLSKAWTRAELRYFTSRAIQDENLRLMIVMVEDCEVPPLLQSILRSLPTDYDLIADRFAGRAGLPAPSLPAGRVDVVAFVAGLTDTSILSLCESILARRGGEIEFGTRQGSVRIQLLPTLSDSTLDSLKSARTQYGNYKYRCNFLDRELAAGGLGVFQPSFELRLAMLTADSGRVMTEIRALVEDSILEIAAPARAEASPQ